MMTAKFDSKWKNMGFTDDDLRRLEAEIMRNPAVGKVMQGTGGLRKMRFAFEGKGKSGSARVTYVDLVVYKTVYFINVYPKNEKDDLTEEEKNDFRKMINNIKKMMD